MLCCLTISYPQRRIPAFLPFSIKASRVSVLLCAPFSQTDLWASQYKMTRMQEASRFRFESLKVAWRKIEIALVTFL